MMKNAAIFLNSVDECERAMCTHTQTKRTSFFLSLSRVSLSAPLILLCVASLSFYLTLLTHSRFGHSISSTRVRFGLISCREFYGAINHFVLGNGSK